MRWLSFSGRRTTVLKLLSRPVALRRTVFVKHGAEQRPTFAADAGGEPVGDRRVDQSAITACWVSLNSVQSSGAEFAHRRRRISQIVMDFVVSNGVSFQRDSIGSCGKQLAIEAPSSSRLAALKLTVGE